MTNFLQLNQPLLVFCVSGPAQKAVLVPFLGGGFYNLFFLFFYLRGILVGVLWSWKCKNLGAISKTPEMRVPFSVKRTLHHGKARHREPSVPGSR